MLHQNEYFDHRDVIDFDAVTKIWLGPKKVWPVSNFYKRKEDNGQIIFEKSLKTLYIKRFLGE